MRRIPLESATSAAGPARRTSPAPDSSWTIVGVIAIEGVDPFDARVAEPAVYATREQHPRANLLLVVNTYDEPDRMREPIRKAVAAFDHDQALPDLKTVNQLVAEDVAPDRLRSLLLSGFAAIALALAGTGLYGLIAYAVAQRRCEIGIRLALGASKRHVRLLVMRELGPLVGAGLAAGLIGAMTVARALKTFLYGVSPADPATLQRSSRSPRCWRSFPCSRATCRRVGRRESIRLGCFGCDPIAGGTEIAGASRRDRGDAESIGLCHFAISA
jgi:hypothetical protein